jgi:hypothetical protein
MSGNGWTAHDPHESTNFSEQFSAQAQANNFTHNFESHNQATPSWARGNKEFVPMNSTNPERVNEDWSAAVSSVSSIRQSFDEGTDTWMKNKNKDKK